MKNILFRITAICLVAVIFLSFSGCKSDDYKQAMTLQLNGDYAAAAEIYSNLGDYKDSTAQLAVCNDMIATIAKYESTKESLDTKNVELDAAIDDAGALVLENPKVLDKTLIPSLETAISAAKAVRQECPARPATAEEIQKLCTELETVDYSNAISEIAEKRQAVENGVAQYALVDNPSEAYIIQCLQKVSGVMEISAATEDNDPNGQLHKAGGYTSQVYFSYELVDQDGVWGTSVIDKGTSCGGSIEVYESEELAEKRNDYLAAFDGSVLSSGSHTAIGTVVVRTSDELTATQQKDLEGAIIAVLLAG